METKELKIELDAEVSDGRYSNLVMISHTAGEFFLDFVLVQPQEPKGKVHSRIILSPIQAKRLLGALAENVSRYEQAYGTVPTHDYVPPSNLA